LIQEPSTVFVISYKTIPDMITLRTLLFLCFFTLLVNPLADKATADPLGLLLTWQQDPTTTITIDWYTDDPNAMRTLLYKAVDTEEWQSVNSDRFPFPFSDRTIHRVELTGLTAESTYHFRIGDEGRIRLFRTMPETTKRPIRFAAGGDVRHRADWMDRTNRRAAAYDVDFVVWGGDLAYADGREDRLYRWFEFLDSTMNTLVTADGRVIPVLAAIGNHEVRGGYYHRNDHERREHLPAYTQTDESRSQIAPYYYSLFAFPGQPGYGVLDFGDYMSILLLDTDHSNPIEGAQTEWLEQVLAERQEVPHLFPNYHVPAYPSVRSPEGTTQTRVRNEWVPLFEQYGVRMVFEAHDHIYKRTFPIRNGQTDSRGIVYIGDGSWGVGTRTIGRDHGDNGPAWYLKRAAEERHAIIVTIQGSHQHVLVINENGQVIDEYPSTPGVERFRTTDTGLRR